MRKEKASEKERAKNLGHELEYFKNRDSLTGQMNLNYTVKIFDNLKRELDMGAVFVSVVDVELMRPSKAEEAARNLSVAMAAMGIGEISRVGFADFLVFTKKYEQYASKALDYLARIADDKVSFAVSSGRTADDFAGFMDKLRREATVARFDFSDAKSE